jgi:hypothetical protein
MRMMIRNLILAPALVAAAALATTSAMATTLKVPFKFVADGKECPAGYYNVDRSMSGNLVTVASRDGSRILSYVLHPGDPAPTDSSVVMKFAAQGESHILHSVQYGALETITDKPSKHAEKPYVSIGAGR